RAIDDRIDLAPKAALWHYERTGDRCERYISDDKKIDIAGRFLPPLGEGPEQKGHANLAGNGQDRLAQHTGDANCLENQTAKFLMDRACGVDAIQDLPADLLSLQHAELIQQLQFALYWPESHACQP